jgi:hypothetical protein
LQSNFHTNAQRCLRIVHKNLLKINFKIATVLSNIEVGTPCKKLGIVNSKYLSIQIITKIGVAIILFLNRKVLPNVLSVFSNNEYFMFLFESFTYFVEN